MANISLKKSWLSIQQASLTIHNKSHQKEWEQVITLAKERHQLILEHFNHFPVSTHSAEFYAAEIPQFMVSEDAIVKYMDLAKDKLSAESSSLKNNRHAIQAYSLATH